jgi:hypothetical protein
LSRIVAVGAACEQGDIGTGAGKAQGGRQPNSGIAPRDE